jgi:hypothetical protein
MSGSVRRRLAMGHSDDAKLALWRAIAPPMPQNAWLQSGGGFDERPGEARGLRAAVDQSEWTNYAAGVHQADNRRYVRGTMNKLDDLMAHFPGGSPSGCGEARNV